MADLIAQADALIKGRLRADRLPECSFDDGRTWQTDDVVVAETFALAADLIEALTAQVAVMGEALRNIADCRETVPFGENPLDFCIDQARLAAAKEPS